MGFERDITIGPARLILGDMRDVLPRLDCRAKMCMTDPPYPLTSGGKNTGDMGGLFARSQYDNSGNLFDMVPWPDMADAIYPALAADANAVIMTSDRQLPLAHVGFAQAGFDFHHTLVWIKNTCTPNRYYMADCEFALFLKKGRARTISNPGDKQSLGCPQHDVSAEFNDIDGTAHPTEKPVALIQRWVENSTDVGDLVIDPFMGSGSTVVAAMRSGRRVIGVEKDPKWFAVAEARARACIVPPLRNAALAAEQGVMSL